MNASLLQIIIFALGMAGDWSEERWNEFCRTVSPFMSQQDIPEFILDDIKEDFGIVIPEEPKFDQWVS